MEHKVSLRQCPQCGKVKTFEIRNKYCCRKCTADSKRTGAKPPAELHRIDGNEWDIALPKTRIHTLAQLIAYAEVDLGVWEVKHFDVNKWEVGLKDKGVILTEALYQVRAHLVNKMVVVAVRAEIEAMQALFLKTAPAQPRKSPVHPRTGHMLELNTTDLHLGKLAWGRETAPAQPPRIMRTTNRMSFCVISLFAEGRTAEG